MATPQASLRAPSDVSVMISYSRTDAVFAQKLWADLKEAGFPTWVDTSGIPGGAEWKKEIHAAIDGAQVVLVVMSPAAMKSKWVRREYAYALRRKKVIIPLDYLACDIPAALARFQTVVMRPSFVADRDAYYAQQLRDLTVAIARYATAVPIPAPPRQSGERALTGTLSLVTVLSAALAAVAGYAGGALLPLAIQPYTSRLFAGAFALLPLSMFALVFRLTRRPDGSVRLYLADRERFLTKLQTRYTNRLKPPFAGALLLTLGLSEDAQAVARPALASQEGPAGAPHLLPAGTSISAAFEGAEGQLLILGAPGAGKSTLLYQLAQDLVGRARANGVIPIPVVFNLATWAQDRKPLEDWMVDQLVETWQAPQTIARVWGERRQLLPLLDGLDEVRQDARDACVAAINRYQRDHGLDPLAVCCRRADYDALEARLDLRTAVVAEPLTREQIDEYLAAGGAPLAALRTLAHDDGQMQDLLSTPLMLSVVALAYKGKGTDAIPTPSDDKRAWTQAVFRDYVPTMLARRPDSNPRAGGKKGAINYSGGETARYLAWLAAQMRAHAQTDMFYLERLQPDWLPDSRARRQWRGEVGLSGIWVGALVGALAGALALLSSDLLRPLVLLGPVDLQFFYRLIDLLIFALGCALLGALVGGVGLVVGRYVNTNAIILSAVSFASFRLARPNLRLLVNGLAAGVVDGVVNGFIAALVVVLGIAGYVYGVVDRVLSGDSLHTIAADYGGSVVVVIVLGSVVVSLLYRMLIPEAIDARDVAAPDEGAKRSLRDGLVFLAACGLVLFVVVGVAGSIWGFEYAGTFLVAQWFTTIPLIPGPASWFWTVPLVDYGTAPWLLAIALAGVVFGLMSGMKYGLGAYLQHRMLLRALARLRLIPAHYIDFLDFAADHILLQSVGGGYRFIHALLLDYFADQWPALSSTEPPKRT